MRWKFSHIRNAVTVTTFVLCVAVGALWVRSLWFRDSIYFATPTWGGVVCSSAGRLVHGGDIWTRPQEWRIERQAIACPDMDHRDPFFLFSIASHRQSWQFNIPHFVAVLLLSVPTAIHFVRSRRA